MGTATGTPDTMDSEVVAREPQLPLSISETSVDVPPMSSVMMRSKPAISETYCAPRTPPAGPDRIVRTGSCAAARAERMPPFDCMTPTPARLARRGALGLGRDHKFAIRSICAKYSLITGIRYALTTVVEVR